MKELVGLSEIPMEEINGNNTKKKQKNTKAAETAETVTVALY